MPALSDGIFHIDSFILEAPKSAIFVGLQNDFMCDFSYSSDGLAPNVGRDDKAGSSNSDFDSQMDSLPGKLAEQLQTCDCDFELDLDEVQQDEEDEAEAEAEEEENEEEAEEELQAEDQEYDDGIGFSCDSDSLEDEFVLVTGQCVVPGNSCSSSEQGSSGGTLARSGSSTSNSTSMELDIVLTPPPPPALGKPKSGGHPLKFLHKII